MRKLDTVLWGNIKRYRNKSVFFRYFSMTLLCITIPFLIYNVILYQSTNTTMRREIETANMQSATNICSTLDVLFTQVGKLSQNLLYNGDIQTFLTFQNQNVDKKYYPLYKEISYLLRDNIAISECIDSIYLYNSKQKYIISNVTTGDIYSFPDNSWIQFVDQLNQQENVFITPRDFSVDTLTTDGVFDYITVVYNLDLFGSNAGALVANIDIQKFEELLNTTSPKNYGYLYVIDKRDKIIYSDNKAMINKGISDIAPLKAHVESIRREKSSGIFDDSSQTLYMAIRSEKTQMLYIYSTFIAQSQHKMQMARYFMFYAILISIVIATIISIFISARTYRSIADVLSIIQDTEKVEELKKNEDDVGNFSEVKFIRQNFLKLIRYNQDMQKDNAQKLLALKKSQSIALQTQINPHFLFNTLHLVNLIIMSSSKCDNKATLIISNLSELLSITLNTKETIVPLSLEIEHVKKYIEIQQMKYDGRFEVQWEIDPDSVECKTVKLILQPLVENAIQHGIISADQKCFLVIGSQIKDNILELLVRDNGVGINREELDKIRLSLDSNDIPENDKIGLINVDQRIKLTFGDLYGLTIESESGIGTLVTVRFPHTF